MKSILRIFMVFLLSSTGTLTVMAQTQSQQQPVGPKPSYEEEITAWHQQRISSLKRPHGWLSLVALDWLEEGDNSVAGFGVVTLNKGAVSYKSLSNVQSKLRGEGFVSGELMTDVDKVEVGSKAIVVIRRGERCAVRMWDGNAETLKKFTGIERFPLSKEWRVEARWEAYEKPKSIKIQSVIPGYEENYVVPGVAIFVVGGKEYRLEPVGEANAHQLFFIFADKTNGSDTYGAGRFLYTDPPKDGKAVLDFNKAINPPCAFSPYATCPLPPASNRLPVRIEAGEKNFGDH
jgi:uncharacterized protein (DUF1684 family)